MINPTSNNKFGSIYHGSTSDNFPILVNQQTPNVPDVILNPTINLPYLPNTQNLPQTVITALQNINNSNANCNCVAGTPYIDETGNCRCDNNIDANEPTPPVKIIDSKDGKPVIYYVTPKTTTPVSNTANDTDIMQTIKDNPVIVVGAVIGLFLLLKGGK